MVPAANPFTLYAYGQISKLNPLDSFYISAAVRGTNVPGGFGSFSIGGTSYTYSDLIYGTPPVLSGDLPGHGIFPGYFAEVAFAWDTSKKTGSVNTENTPQFDPTASPGTDFYYFPFAVDVSGLSTGFSVHFDLYTTHAVCEIRQGNTCIQYSTTVFELGDKAPPSHDVSAYPNGSTPLPVPVPAPGVLSLLGLGFLWLGLSRRKLATLKLV
ncbi:MAG: choice-of-anchor N protein [Pseudomonadales bacterium]|nr:choice-of-anchor N protein [Pseudomonadales bacterium]MCP5345647.1 choice-of-anchor N protein [Pseudomonadales bacterium]